MSGEEERANRQAGDTSPEDLLAETFRAIDRHVAATVTPDVVEGKLRSFMARMVNETMREDVEAESPKQARFSTASGGSTRSSASGGPSKATVELAAETFARELALWRTNRGMTKKQLAARMGFDPSYISHIEGHLRRPTEDFARRAEAVLSASGAIWRRFQEYDEARQARGALTLLTREPVIQAQWLPPGAGLVVELEEAQLTYRDGNYRLVVRRALYNAGGDPVTRYLIRVAVDRYPGQPQKSDAHHRLHPLAVDKLGLLAECGELGVAENMHWRTKVDRNAFKEIWLLFENDKGRFPLYPGERTTVEYSYSVSDEQWGTWFERAVRLPTRRLVVQMRFPADLDPQVWGVETSMAAEEAPLRTPISREHDGDQEVFTWRIDDPSLNARFQLQWRFRNQ